MGGPVSVDHQTPKTRWRAPSGVLEGGEGMGLAGELLGFARADALMPAGAEPRAEVGQFIQDGVDAVAAKNAGVAHRDAVVAHGAPISPSDGAPIVSAVTRQQLRQVLIAGGWFPDDLLPNPASQRFPPKSGAATLDRKAYDLENKALQTLQRNRLAAFNRDYVWLV